MTLFSQRKRLWLLLTLLVVTAAAAWLPGALPGEKEMLIPVEPTAMPPGLTLAAPLRKNLEVRVRGPKSAVSAVSDQNIAYRLDLSGVQAGIQTIALQKEAVSLPAKLSVDAITPSFLTVRIDQLMEKQVPVVLNLVGRPAAGLQIAGSAAIPPVALLTGPEQVLTPLTAIQTHPIEINGAMESFQRKVPLDLPELVRTDAASMLVTADIVIDDEIETRILEGLPIEGTHTAYAYRITPPTLDLTLMGPVRVLDRLQSENGVKAHVNLERLKPGIHHERATISLPGTATVVAVTPEFFTIEIVQRK